jgi:flagellar protein FlaG
MSTDGINALVISLLPGGDKAVAKGKDQAATARAENPAVRTADSAGADKQTPDQLTQQQQAEDITKVLNEKALQANISIRFRVDQDIDRIVVSIFDNETEEVIRQVPPEELVNLSKSLVRMAGLLFNKTA